MTWTRTQHFSIKIPSRLEWINISNPSQEELPITANWARQTRASITFSFWNKNRTKSAIHLLHITADCTQRKNKNFFFSKFASYFWKKTISRQNNIESAARELTKPVYYTKWRSRFALIVHDWIQTSQLEILLKFYYMGNLFK